MSQQNYIANQQRMVECAARSKFPLLFASDQLYYSFKDEKHKYKLSCRHKDDMDKKLLKWVFKLAERNVGHLYRETSIGWQPKVKQTDLNKAWARYLLAQNSDGHPVAYAMFRFDMDYGYSVLYCYEIHIEPGHRRKGLGKYMMNILEQCAQYWKMKKIVLTVLKNNDNARNFFINIGYTLDDTSPDSSEMVDYEILSKVIVT